MKLLYASTLIAQLVILYASHIGFFWAVLILLAANSHAVVLALWKE